MSLRTMLSPVRRTTAATTRSTSDCDSGSTIIHNVFEFGGCLPHGLTTPCGYVDAWREDERGAGTGTLIRDNIMTGIANGDGGMNATLQRGSQHVPSRQSMHGNVATRGQARVTSPEFRCSQEARLPRRSAGSRYAPGSPGVGQASDGTNIGLELPTNSCGSAGTGSGGGSERRRRLGARAAAARSSVGALVEREAVGAHSPARSAGHLQGQA